MLPLVPWMITNSNPTWSSTSTTYSSASSPASRATPYQLLPMLGTPTNPATAPLAALANDAMEVDAAEPAQALPIWTHAPAPNAVALAEIIHSRALGSNINDLTRMLDAQLALDRAAGVPEADLTRARFMILSTAIMEQCLTAFRRGHEPALKAMSPARLSPKRVELANKAIKSAVNVQDVVPDPPSGAIKKRVAAIIAAVREEQNPLPTLLDNVQELKQPA